MKLNEEVVYCGAIFSEIYCFFTTIKRVIIHEKHRLEKW